MHIALTADPELPVPPELYGGIERIVDLLARGLTARGHDVTLFANPQSHTEGHLVPYRGGSSRSFRDTMRNAVSVARGVLSRRCDLVHSFSRVAYLAPLLPFPIPKLMTYQREITRRSVSIGHRLSRGTLHFAAISRKMMRPVEDIGSWHLVYNGVNLKTYDFVERVDQTAPLVFLGRIEPVKGTHLAIELARRTGSRLVIAGNVPAEHQAYFEGAIKPWLDHQITYVGPVNDAEKNALLGGARAFLMPIQWEEPFGIVMAEALACGTPVLGLDRGAVPEIVEDGVTGFVRQDIDGLVDAASRIHQIDRGACRLRAENLFCERSLVDGYLGVYQHLMATVRRPGHRYPKLVS